MHNNKQNFLRFIVVTGLIAGISLSSTTTQAATPSNDGLITLQVRQITSKLSAYAQVTPLAVVKIRALARGNLSHLEVVPGTVVSANQILARLTGPLMQSRLTTSQQNLAAARAKARSANQALHIAQHKYAARLTTQQRLDTAISNQAAAEAAVQIAVAQHHEVQNMQTLRAPVNGTVLSTHAANGEQTVPDQIVFTLLPANKLWLRATFYGADTNLLHLGMTGHFKPTDNGKPIPVKIVAIAPNLSPDSGQVIELIPDPASDSRHWVSGAWGKLMLTGQTKAMISVPTSALILDRGRWWVLLHTSNGDVPHEVVPGLAHGWSTAIRAGLKPGQQIVVKNAFLRYHHGIARTYMPPD